MRVRLKPVIIATAVVLVTLSLLFVPGLPWSARCQHYVKRVAVRAEMKLARWRGHEPRLMSIAGRLNAPGVRVQALDSRSGWAALSDREGRFALPDVMWYPGASFELVVSSDDSTGKLIKVRAPEAFPEGGVFNVGELDAGQGTAVELASLSGDNSVTREAFDSKNTAYYEELFEKLTADKHTDQEKIGAIHDYVSGKLDYTQTQPRLGSPRRVLESGSEFCGHLSAAMETLLVIGGYKARAVDITAGGNQCDPHREIGRDVESSNNDITAEGNPCLTHVVVEVLYGGEWHLYDPTFGYKLQNDQGEVLSYKDVRLNTNLISENLFTRFTPKARRRLAALLAGIYGTGYHHYYCFKGKS